MGIFRIVWSQGLNQQKIKGASYSAEIVPELGRDLGKGYGHRNFCHLVKELQKKLYLNSRNNINSNQIPTFYIADKPRKYFSHFFEPKIWEMVSLERRKSTPFAKCTIKIKEK